MTILSLYILFGCGRKRSHPILIGCWTLDDGKGLVGTIKHFNPLLGEINSFLVPYDRAYALRVTFEWIFARNMNCVITTCIRKSTDILNVKRRDV